jgi:hypothetical protein
MALGEEEMKEKDDFNIALDVRKFEIELYWKRATYFWTLIAVAFAGYFAILSQDESKLPDKAFFAFVVGCVGFVFTWGWFLANRGSKYWQENWENHINRIEKKIKSEPLFTEVLHRPTVRSAALKEKINKLILDPMPISVSKINQWVSTFTLAVWCLLVCYSFVNSLGPFGWTIALVLSMAVMTGLFVVAMFFCSRTFLGKMRPVSERIDFEIQDKTQE